MRLLTALALLAAALATLACSTSESVTVVNPTQQTLFVQVNERAPFAIDPGQTARTKVPALDRLAPITITARDGDGRTIFYRSTTIQLLRAAQLRLELTPAGDPFDPFAGRGEIPPLTN